MPSFFLMTRPPPSSPLFPSTPLFRPPIPPPDIFAPSAPAASDAWTRPSNPVDEDRKSTRLNSSHGYISYAVFFFNDTATPELSPLPLHAPLPTPHPAPRHFRAKRAGRIRRLDEAVQPRR